MTDITFSTLGVPAPLVAALAADGKTSPFPIQVDTLPDTLVIDFNFAYNPSCAYDPSWSCPLAQPGNTLRDEIPVGERMPR